LHALSEGLAADEEVTIVRAYLKETDPGEEKRMAVELYELLRRSGLRGATMFRGIMGFGPHGSAEGDILHLAGNLPTIIEFFASPDEAEAAIESLCLHKPDLNVVCWRATIRHTSR
jgi:uncharacterized protein